MILLGARQLRLQLFRAAFSTAAPFSAENKREHSWRERRKVALSREYVLKKGGILLFGPLSVRECISFAAALFIPLGLISQMEEASERALGCDGDGEKEAEAEEEQDVARRYQTFLLVPGDKAKVDKSLQPPNHIYRCAPRSSSKNL